MARIRKTPTHVYAVVRVDDVPSDGPDRVTVKEVVSSMDVAEAEVARLNDLNRDKGCVYFWQTTRLYPEGDSAGTRLPAADAAAEAHAAVRPPAHMTGLLTVDRGRQLELAVELRNQVWPLLTVIADEETEELWVELHVGEERIQVPATSVREVLDYAVDYVHSESWFERNAHHEEE